MSVTSLLMKVFAHDVAATEPRIVTLAQPIRIVGMGIDTTLRTVYRDVPRLGARFREYTRDHPIPGRKEPRAFAAVSKGYDREKGAFHYFMGDVVTGEMPASNGLKGFEILAITYAVFPVRPRNRFGWGMAIANVKRHAYDVWLPNSDFEPAGVIDDFELHDERSERMQDPEIDLYVAVRKKQKA